MKKIIFLLILCVFAFNIKAQELVIPQDTLPSYIKYYQLGPAQSQAWEKIEKEWKKEYLKILREQKIKMNCAACTSVYMDAVISITAEGKMGHYRLIKSKKCGEPFSKGLEIRFMKWFFNYKFPKELQNMKIEIHLGDSLKC
jgi:hypothetical protein